MINPIIHLMRWAVLIVLMLASARQAAAWQVTVCVKHAVDYLDADLPDAPLDDFYSTNGDKTSRGVLTMVQNNTSGAITFLGNTSGATGCTPPITANAPMKITVYSSATVNGNTVVVRNDDVLNEVYTWTAPIYTPTSNVTHTVTTPPSDRWGVLAAAAYGLYRHNAGLSGEIFDFYVADGDFQSDPNMNCSGSCMRGGDAYMSSDGKRRRYTTLHEMGHAVWYFADGESSPNTHYCNRNGFTNGDCAQNCFTDLDRSHEMNSMEFQGAAVYEGWAHFWGAVTFNDAQFNDCGYVYYKSQNYDLDPTIESPVPHQLSCESGPVDPFMGNYAYMESECNGNLENRGVELDWLRMWWDLHTEHDITVAALIGAIADSNPPTWNDTDLGSVYDDPWYRIMDGAVLNGLTVEFADEFNANGVAH